MLSAGRGRTARLPRPRRASGAEVLQADLQAATSSAALDIEPDGCPRWPPSGLVGGSRGHGTAAARAAGGAGAPAQAPRPGADRCGRGRPAARRSAAARRPAARRPASAATRRCRPRTSRTTRWTAPRARAPPSAKRQPAPAWALWEAVRAQLEDQHAATPEVSGGAPRPVQKVGREIALEITGSRGSRRRGTGAARGSQPRCVRRRPASRARVEIRDLRREPRE